jgi:hypothetical protein
MGGLEEWVSRAHRAAIASNCVNSQPIDVHSERECLYHDVTACKKEGSTHGDDTRACYG